MDFSNHCLHIGTTIEDTREGTTVCTQCSRVLELNMSFPDPKLWQKKDEESSSNVYNFVYDSCHRMHLPLAVVERILHQYKKFQKNPAFKKTNYEILAAYSIYYHLKQENIGRSIETVARFTGVDSNRIWRCELSDESSPLPIQIENLIRVNYKYLNLSEEDCQNIIVISNFFKDTNYSPVTLSATLTWTYCKIQKINASLASVRALYNCSHMSIYRCRKHITLEKVKHILDIVNTWFENMNK